MPSVATAVALACAALACVSLAAGAGAAAAQACPEIPLARGVFSGEEAGQLSDGVPLCFTFGSGAGHTGCLQIPGNDNACFTVRGVVDCEADFAFTTRARSCEVRVVRLFRCPARGRSSFVWRSARAGRPPAWRRRGRARPAPGVRRGARAEA